MSFKATILSVSIDPETDEIIGEDVQNISADKSSDLLKKLDHQFRLSEFEHDIEHNCLRFVSEESEFTYNEPEFKYIYETTIYLTEVTEKELPIEILTPKQETKHV